MYSKRKLTIQVYDRKKFTRSAYGLISDDSTSIVNPDPKMTRIRDAGSMYKSR